MPLERRVVCPASADSEVTLDRQRRTYEEQEQRNQSNLESVVQIQAQFAERSDHMLFHLIR